MNGAWYVKHSEQNKILNLYMLSTTFQEIGSVGSAEKINYQVITSNPNPRKCKATRSLALKKVPSQSL